MIDRDDKVFRILYLATVFIQNNIATSYVASEIIAKHENPFSVAEYIYKENMIEKRSRSRFKK